MAAISREVATGRKINGRDGFTAPVPPVELVPFALIAVRVAPSGVWSRRAYLKSRLSRCPAIYRSCCWRTTSPGLMPSTCVMPPSVTPGFTLRVWAKSFLNHIHERRLPILLDGGGGNERHALQGVDQQPACLQTGSGRGRHSCCRIALALLRCPSWCQSGCRSSEVVPVAIFVCALRS